MTTETTEKIAIKEWSETIPMRWKTEPCFTGEQCWCRVIVPEDDVEFEGGHEVYLVTPASLPKDLAEHIVEIHNKWLESGQATKERK